MRLLSNWRLPLRLAWRDVCRNRARSALILLMIALPVLAVTAADVLIRTVDVSGAESIDRRVGAAQALVSVTAGSGPVEQAPDPDEMFAITVGNELPMPSAVEVSALLDGSRLLEIRTAEVRLATNLGAATVQLTEVNLADPLTNGLFELKSGRWPQSEREVVVNQSLASKGYAVGTRFSSPAPRESDLRVVGVAESGSLREQPVAAGPIGAFDIDAADQKSWLVDGAPVTWSEVRALNAIGATVRSRAVIANPPPVSEWPESIQPSAGIDESLIAIGALVAIMALLEVVLLAGPAFAVGARRQQRTLALMAAAGGTPAQARRTVISSAIALGSIAAALGVSLGIALAFLFVPIAQRHSASHLGPFDVPWLHLLGVAGFGLLSALLAAVVPAWVASRQDVVAVLAGRRGDRKPSLRSPVFGLVLLALAIAGSVAGATGRGEILVAASAIPAILGAVLLIAPVMAVLGRSSGRFPLAIRYAIRDAQRYRTRTVPAVAAVVATVAGVVALGIGMTSDAAENKETYAPTLVDGFGLVTAYEAEGDEDTDWDLLASAVRNELPDTKVEGLAGVSGGNVLVRDENDLPLLANYGDALGSTVMVGSGEFANTMPGLTDSEVADASKVLADGGSVIFVSSDAGLKGRIDVQLRFENFDRSLGESTDTTVARTEAYAVAVPPAWGGPEAFLSETALADLGAPVGTVSLGVSGEISPDEEDRVNEVLAGLDATAALYVERGYQDDDETQIMQLVLLALGTVLMLGGTLTSTFLALTDARPDLATLAAVGAGPRTRRGVAAAYALVVGFVGSLMGAAVGLIPGIAVVYPLTRQDFAGGTACVSETDCIGIGESIGPFLDVPWLTICALVLALPLLTALIVGITTRSRLPLMARLD